MFRTGDTLRHEHYGLGKIVAQDEATYVIDFGNKGQISISKNKEHLLQLAQAASASTTSNSEFSELESVLRKIFDDYSDVSQVVPMHDKWLGGKLILVPGKDGLKEKEIPIETFFHKIVMMRDRLRVLEQNINSNTKLNDEDKINMQQYITRIYGSLTTFNVLFKNDYHYFKGEKKED